MVQCFVPVMGQAWHSDLRESGSTLIQRREGPESSLEGLLTSVVLREE